ncbi:MAG: hypothetical protein HY668_01690 [Chloroflexi bacterium]|nr:hypothetical protein [Chloroflexota bacterium]
MGIKILWQMDGPVLADSADPLHGDRQFVNECLLKFARGVARPGTEIVESHLDPWTSSNWLLYPRTVAKVAVLNRVIEAEKEGYDAVFPGISFDDFFVEECRQAVKIPVLGDGESAELVAQLVGKKFAVVTVAPRFIQVMEWNIRLHGWEDRALKHRPVRSFDPWYWEAMKEAWRGRPEKLIADFDKVAQECVREGADTIICGCAPGGAALAAAGYNEVRGTGVPVVPAVAAMVKMAEVMVDLQKSFGLAKTEAEVGPYQTTPPEVLAKIQKDFGFGRPSEVKAKSARQL